MDRKTAKEIDSVAADWAARLDRGVLSEIDDRTLEAWLAQDPRHAGAFARARAVSLYSERAKALGETYDPAQFAPASPEPAIASPSRRQVLWRGGSIAAGLTAAMVGGVFWTSRGEAFETQRGQMTVVPLADGSIISLNTSSRIRVLYTSHSRTVRLEAGEAFFDIAPDRERPFIVDVGPARLSAARSRFAVSHLNDAPIEVLVSSGAVEVKGASQQAPVKLGANMRALAAMTNGQFERTSTTTVAPVEIERTMAWREGRIAFEGHTLREAAAEFLRYSDTRIVIDDPAIANEPITGLFQVNDPVGFARAVADSFNLKAEIGEKQVHLHR